MKAEVVRRSSQAEPDAGSSQHKIAPPATPQSTRDRRARSRATETGERRESKATESGAGPAGTARDRRSSRWDEHRRARREQLVDATLAAVAKHGAGVGMEEIAAEAGTSKTVVYRHFADRAELYVAVCNRVAAAAAAQAARGDRDRQQPPARRWWPPRSTPTSAFIEADPELYRFVVHHADARPAQRADPLDDLSDLVGEQAAAAIAVALQQAGRDRRPPPPGATASSAWSARPPTGGCAPIAPCCAANSPHT